MSIPAQRAACRGIAAFCLGIAAALMVTLLAQILSGVDACRTEPAPGCPAELARHEPENPRG